MLVFISLRYTSCEKTKESTQRKKSPIKIKEQSTYCINLITHRSKLKILGQPSSTGPGALHKQVTSRSKSNLILELSAFLRALLTASLRPPSNLAHGPESHFIPVWGHRSLVGGGQGRSSLSHPLQTQARRICLCPLKGSPHPEYSLIISAVSLNIEDILI